MWCPRGGTARLSRRRSPCARGTYRLSRTNRTTEGWHQRLTRNRRPRRHTRFRHPRRGGWLGLLLTEPLF